jgi:hypothetical protein
MKRDMDLIRALAQFLEDKPDDKPVEVPPISGYSELQIKQHLLLMHEAGLIRCERIRSTTDPERVIYVLAFGLSWQGHEFLDAARDETVWRKVTAEIKAKGLSVTFAVLQTLLLEAVKKSAGL